MSCCRQPNYIPPKRPYSFLAMLDDILIFAADHLVDNGRLSMWMPTANEDLQVLKVPSNPYLELTSTCIQEFNKCRCSPAILEFGTKMILRRVEEASHISSNPRLACPRDRWQERILCIKSQRQRLEPFPEKGRVSPGPSCGFAIDLWADSILRSSSRDFDRLPVRTEPE